MAIQRKMAAMTPEEKKSLNLIEGVGVVKDGGLIQEKQIKMLNQILPHKHEH